ncbi:MAG: STAS domain-containing protein [Phycisphaerae bacterium]
MRFYCHGVDNDVLVISADGGLNLANAAEFVRQVEALVDAGLRRIIIDCDKLTYISSFGIGVLLKLHRRLAKHGGDVKLCNLRGTAAKALALFRVNTFFAIYGDLERASLAFRPKTEG